MLTEKHIEYLHLICEEQGVKYYDLQTELVDHIASVVEEKIFDNPESNFFDLVDETVLSFGRDGLSRMANQKRIELKRSFLNLFKQNLHCVFSGKNLFIAIAFLMFLIFFYFFVDQQTRSTLFFYYGFFFFSVGIFLGGSIERMTRQPQKRLEIIKQKFVVEIYSFCFLVPVFIRTFLPQIQNGLYNNLLFVVLITALNIIITLIMIARYKTKRSSYLQSKKDFPLAFKN